MGGVLNMSKDFQTPEEAWRKRKEDLVKKAGPAEWNDELYLLVSMIVETFASASASDSSSSPQFPLNTKQFHVVDCP